MCAGTAVRTVAVADAASAHTGVGSGYNAAAPSILPANQAHPAPGLEPAHARAQPRGYGHGLNRQVFPSIGTTPEGSRAAIALFAVPKVCCIITGANPPSLSHG